eukprot:scaffold68727_cov56-Phaeocystis_antarctica.AAC.1
MKIAVIPIFNPKVAGRGVKANNMDPAGCPRSALQVSHLLCGQSAGSPGVSQPTTGRGGRATNVWASCVVAGFGVVAPDEQRLQTGAGCCVAAHISIAATPSVRGLPVWRVVLQL